MAEATTSTSGLAPDNAEPQAPAAPIPNPTLHIPTDFPGMNLDTDPLDAVLPMPEVGDDGMVDWDPEAFSAFFNPEDDANHDTTSPSTNPGTSPHSLTHGVQASLHFNNLDSPVPQIRDEWDHHLLAQPHRLDMPGLSFGGGGEAFATDAASLEEFLETLPKDANS